jgi:hypothetical protein
LSNAEEMISEHSAREATAQDEGGSIKKEKGRREGGSKPKQPRARAKTKKFIAASRFFFWALVCVYGPCRREAVLVVPVTSLGIFLF